MSLPFRYDDLSRRFADVRAWAANSFSGINRCTVCLGYVLSITRRLAEGDLSLADLPGTQEALRSALQLPGLSNATAGRLLFVRAAELLPRVQEIHGPPDVRGTARQVWPQVARRRGVTYIEDCYETAGDRKAAEKTAGLWSRATGDHWDLYDGTILVSLEQLITPNRWPGEMCFWQARN